MSRLYSSSSNSYHSILSGKRSPKTAWKSVASNATSMSVVLNEILNSLSPPFVVISDQIIDVTLCQALTEGTSCVLLRLENCGISRDVMRKLSSALATNDSLTALELNSCKIETLPSIPEHLKSRLMYLSLWNCQLQTLCSVDSVVDPLSTFENLTSLDLSSNKLSGTEVSQLVSRLPRLRWLDVGSNDIGCDFRGLDVFCSALELNSVLKGLGLAWNSLGDEGACRIAQMLGVNSVLESLDLRWNSIGGEGCNSLIRVLQSPNSCSSLRKLRLGALWSEAGTQWVRVLRAQLASNVSQRGGKKSRFFISKPDLELEALRLCKKSSRAPNSSPPPPPPPPPLDSVKENEAEREGDVALPPCASAEGSVQVTARQGETRDLKEQLRHLQESHCKEKEKLLSEISRLKALKEPSIARRLDQPPSRVPRWLSQVQRLGINDRPTSERESSIDDSETRGCDTISS